MAVVFVGGVGVDLFDVPLEEYACAAFAAGDDEFVGVVGVLDGECVSHAGGLVFGEESAYSDGCSEYHLVVLVGVEEVDGCGCDVACCGVCGEGPSCEVAADFL